jgi:prevent-host-death family protein
MRSVSSTEARVHFGDLLTRVEREGEGVVVERGGRQAAVILSIAEYKRLLRRSQSLLHWTQEVESVQYSVQSFLSRKADLVPTLADLLAESREGPSENSLGMP